MKLQKIIEAQLFRYFLSVLAVTTLTVIVSSLLHPYLHDGVLAVLVVFAWIIATFLLNKFYVYKNPNKGYLSSIVQLLLVVASFIANILVSVIVLAVAPDSFILISLLLCVGLSIAMNYFMFTYIFTRVKTKKLSDSIRNLTLKSVLKIVALNLVLSLPIVIFSLGLLASNEKIIPGDPDYFFQAYEALRRSVFEFHQLPYWNSWMAGGIPLFANIQFGLISIQTPFVMLFGSVFGMKLAIVAYQLIAFFGFRKLFKDGFKSTPIKAVLLAYIPVFGSFFVDRIVAGHFTFLLVAFAPWLFYFFLTRKNKYSWLYFALIYSLMIWSSPHYMTIMTLVIIGIWFFYQSAYDFIKALRAKKIEKFKQKFYKDVTFFIKAGALVLLLCFYRMFFVVDYIRDFPRQTGLANEAFTGFFTGLYAIWGPDQYASPPALPSGWGWTEAATYIGIGTLVCVLIIASVTVYSFFKKRGSQFTYPPTIFIALFLTFFVLGMANFSPLAPYTLLSHLPVFDSMRVATRWLMWASLIVLFVIAAYKGKKFAKIINILLLVTVVELFASGSQALSNSYFLDMRQHRAVSSPFEQGYKYDLPRANYANDQHYLTNYAYDENFLESTRNNVGQVIAGDSLVDTRQPDTTIRCGVNQGSCMFISSNAQVEYWSPNKAVIKRLSEGPIVINANPGNGWLVNGVYAFKDGKITDPLSTLILTDPSEKIVLEYAPKLSPLWLKTTVKASL